MKKIAITADWHIDKDNRLEDMVATLKRLVAKVVALKPDYFLFLGDAYKNWRPTPLEMYFFHMAVLDIANADISVIILVGNHDYPESEEFQGKHCFTEIKSLVAGKVRIIDEPEVVELDHLGGMVGLFIPHVPKAKIEGSYDNTFGMILRRLEEESRMQYPKHGKAVFTHAYLNEAKIGAGDMVLSGDRGVNASTMSSEGINLAFLGDIHKSQRVLPGYYYPGSIERVDFGERDDDKGFIVYDSKTGVVDFVDLESRRMVDIVLDLVNPGLVTAGQEKLSLGLDVPPMEYIREALAAKNAEGALKDAIIRIKVIATKEQKAQLDGLDDVIGKYVVDDIGSNHLKSISYEVTDSQVVRNADVNEALSPKEALGKWVGMQEGYTDETRQGIVTAGERIIKG